MITIIIVADDFFFFCTSVWPTYKTTVLGILFYTICDIVQALNFVLKIIYLTMLFVQMFLRFCRQNAYLIISPFITCILSKNNTLVNFLQSLCLALSLDEHTINSYIKFTKLSSPVFITIILIFYYITNHFWKMITFPNMFTGFVKIIIVYLMVHYTNSTPPSNYLIYYII